MKLYAIVQCLKCHKFLGIKSTQKTKTCPHCGKRNVTKKLKKHVDLTYGGNIPFAIDRLSRLDAVGLFERVWNQ